MRKTNKTKTSQNIHRMREMLSQAAKYRKIALNCTSLRCAVATQMAMPGATLVTVAFPPKGELCSLELGRCCSRAAYDALQSRLLTINQAYVARAAVCEANAKRLRDEIAKALNLKTF